MSDREPSHSGEAKPVGTLLGVPAPRVESSAESPLRSPVFVRSGTSVADVEPPPLPRMALPSRPLSPTAREVAAAKGDGQAGSGLFGWLRSLGASRTKLFGRELPLGFVAIPILVLWLSLAVVLLSGSRTAPPPRAASMASRPESNINRGAESALDAQAPPHSEPSARASEGLPSREILRLAEERAQTRQKAAQALTAKLINRPLDVSDKATQSELLRFAADPETAREALAGMAAGAGPSGPDLLYEIWTGTSQRTSSTELSRELLYSSDQRAKASAALAVALDLRSAETCEAYRDILPRALKDGDRRSLHLLTKLTAKRGCGRKKAEDCYACLRDQPDELKATISAVQSRRAPTLPTP